MQAVIYARYSSDAQREASIEDQVRGVPRAMPSGRAGSWPGSTRIERSRVPVLPGPGYQALLADAERGLFDVVVVEALDRIGRRLADVAGLHDRLEFRRIALHAVNMGSVTTMHVGLLGTMAQLYLSDLKDKTRRGQLGRVLQGRAAGGRAYGYRAVEGETGSRRIDEGEAAVVRRICKLFADGVSPRAIARKLNAEKRAGSGRAAVAGHDHPRPGRARHRHPEQRALQRPAGLESLLVHQGPAHRAPTGAAEPALTMGAHPGPRAADRRGGSLAGGEASPGRTGVQGGA